MLLPLQSALAVIFAQICIETMANYVNIIKEVVVAHFAAC